MKKRKKSRIVKDENPGINVPQLIYSIKRNRYWFLLYGIIGLALAFGYNFLFPQKYKVVTSLLIKNDNSQATLTTVHTEVPEDKKGFTVADQVGILSSFTLNYQTLQNLKWNTSWAKDEMILSKDLYKNDPYIIDTGNNAFQLKGIPLKIKQLNNRQYLVKCNEVLEINGDKHKINFEGTAYFDKPFKNQYFNFTLHHIRGRLVDDDESFILTFNNLTDLAKSYQQQLKITSDDVSNLVTMELISTSPEKAIDYLTELDKVYIDYGLTEKNRRAANTVKFIDNQIAGISDSLQSSGNDFTNYRSSNNITDIDQQSSRIVSDLSKVQGDVASARMQLDYFSGLKRYLTNADAMKGLVAPSVVGITDPSLNASVVKLGDLYHQRQVLSQTAQDKSPQMISLDDEIAYTQKSIQENVNNLISNARVQLQSLDRQEASINSSKASIPKKEQDLSKIKRNFDFNNSLYTYLLQKRSEAQIAQASRDPDAQIIDQASYGTATLKGFKHPVNLIIGFILGLIFPLIYLVVKGFFRNRLMYVDDVKEQLQPSIVGNILHNKFNHELPVMLFPHSEITESFRSLRINLQYLLQSLSTKVISVHSSIAGEGKTFVSSNLAAILALNNKKVLLIDADLRQPRTHQIFENDNKIGLSDYLSERLDFGQVIRETQIKGLHMVTSGPKPDYPSELLGTNLMSEFITEAKKYYEYIIINNAPLDIVKDAMMVAPYSDVNLFLLRIHKSSVNQLKYINELILEGIVQNVVVALNNVTDDSYAISRRGDHGYYNDNKMLKLK
ncbi:GumC family protein [Mucilaginibacter sp. McL0603]|uniref:GumC family protein n=1 Tax=Mucilaginibacter sp. McL0603 TaxID=3415670 RepID=UPI003CF7BB3E